MEKHARLEDDIDESEIHDNYCSAMTNLANIARKMNFTFLVDPATSVEVLNSYYYKLFTHVLGYQDSNSVYLAK